MNNYLVNSNLSNYILTFPLFFKVCGMLNHEIYPLPLFLPLWADNKGKSLFSCHLLIHSHYLIHDPCETALGFPCDVGD